MKCRASFVAMKCAVARSRARSRSSADRPAGDYFGEGGDVPSANSRHRPRECAARESRARDSR
jgi:hypothetical protein